MDEYMTLKEVAALLRVSNRTVIRWVQAGYIHPSKIGHTIRFKRAQLLWDVEQLQSGQAIREIAELG